MILYFFLNGQYNAKIFQATHHGWPNKQNHCHKYNLMCLISKKVCKFGPTRNQNYCKNQFSVLLPTHRSSICWFWKLHVVVTSQLSNRHKKLCLLNKALGAGGVSKKIFILEFYSASIESELFFKIGLKNINYL